MGRPRWPKMKSHHLMWRLKLQIFLVLFPHLKSTFDIHHISCVSSSSTFGIFNFHMHNIDHNFTWFKTRGSFPFLDLIFFSSCLMLLRFEFHIHNIDYSKRFHPLISCAFLSFTLLTFWSPFNFTCRESQGRRRPCSGRSAASTTSSAATCTSLPS